MLNDDQAGSGSGSGSGLGPGPGSGASVVRSPRWYAVLALCLAVPWVVFDVLALSAGWRRYREQLPPEADTVLAQMAAFVGGVLIIAIIGAVTAKRGTPRTRRLARAAGWVLTAHLGFVLVLLLARALDDHPSCATPPPHPHPACAPAESGLLRPT